MVETRLFSATLKCTKTANFQSGICLCLLQLRILFKYAEIFAAQSASAKKKKMQHGKYK